MAEFAVAAMALLMFVFGIMEFARLVYAYHTVADAARLGSRWAMVRGTACPATTCPAQATDVRTFVRTKTPLLDPSTVTVTTTWTKTATCVGTSNQGPGCIVTVTVSYPFAFVVPFVSNAGVTINSSSQMIIAQ